MAVREHLPLEAFRDAMTQSTMPDLAENRRLLAPPAMALAAPFQQVDLVMVDCGQLPPGPLDEEMLDGSFVLGVPQ